jgi:RNA polymerase-binding protein DksA
MSAARKPTRGKAASSKASGKKTTAKKTSTKSSAKRGRATQTSSRKSTKKTVAKAPAKKTATRKGSGSRGVASSSRAKKSTAGRKKTVAKAPAKKTTKSTVAKTSKASATEKPTLARKPEKKALIRKPPPKAPPVKKPRPAKLDKATLAKIKEQLQGERVDLQRQQQELEQDSFEGSQSDMTGEVGLDEDFADAGTATFDRERDLSIRNNIRDLIEQIDRALSRIDDGSYGSCERCGQPIDAARLKALPHASLCLDCKRREERVR